MPLNETIFYRALDQGDLSVHELDRFIRALDYGGLSIGFVSFIRALD